MANDPNLIAFIDVIAFIRSCFLGAHRAIRKIALSMNEHQFYENINIDFFKKVMGEMKTINLL